MTPGFALALTLGALVASPGAATPTKHRKPTFDMENVAVPVRQVPAPKPRADMAPSLTVEQFVAGQRRRLDKLVGRQLPLLHRMIKHASPDDPQLPDYYFRLAELCTERYRYLEHEARSLDEAIYRAEQAEHAPVPPSQTEDVRAR
jgi:hypothetical protein